MTFSTLKAALNAVTDPHGLTPEYDEVIITCGTVYDDQYDRPTITGIFYAHAGQPVTPEPLLAAAWPFMNRTGTDAVDSRIFEPLTLSDQASYRVYHALSDVVRPYVNPGRAASATRFTEAGCEPLHCPALSSALTTIRAEHTVRTDSVTFTGSAQEITAKLAGSSDLLLRHVGQMTRLMIHPEAVRFGLAQEFVADVLRLRLGVPVTHEGREYLITTNYSGNDLGLIDISTGVYGLYVYRYHPSHPSYTRHSSTPRTFPKALEHTASMQGDLNRLVVPARIERHTRRAGTPKPVRLGEVQAAPSMRACITSNLRSTVLLRFPDGEVFSLQLRFNKPLPVGEIRPLDVQPYDVTRQTGGRNELCVAQFGDTLDIQHLGGQHTLGSAQLASLRLLVNSMERHTIGGANFPLERAWGLRFSTYTTLRAPYFSAYYDPALRRVNFRGQFDEPSCGLPKDVHISLAETHAAAQAHAPSEIGGYRLPPHLARHVIGNISRA